MSLNARFGLSQSGAGLPDVYRDLLNQEVVGLTFSVPIFDWGLGKGKVQKAKAAEEVVKAQNLQDENDFRRKIFTAVGQFNNQRQQCVASKRAMEIASERYSLMMDMTFVFDSSTSISFHPEFARRRCRVLYEPKYCFKCAMSLS